MCGGFVKGGAGEVHGLINQVSLAPAGKGMRSSRLAMRVCQPGPVAFHLSITSGASRRLIICFGLTDLGRPAFLKTARHSMSSVSSGSSSYYSG